MSSQVTETRPIDADEVVARFGDLPTLAPVAVEVLRLADDDRATIDDIALVIQRDPGLASQLLRLANSSLYGMGGEVSTLARAASILGLRTVKLLSLSFAVVARVEGDSADSVVWRRTLASSALAQTIATACEPRVADEAFVAALLGTVGRVALCSDPRYALAQAESGGWLEPDTEEQLFGLTSDDVTVRILDGWGLPPVLTDALRLRSQPQTGSGPAAQVAAVLAMADAAAAFVCAEDDQAAAALQLCQASASTNLGLSADASDGLVVAAEPAMEEIAAMFQASDPHQAPVMELILRAKETMTRLTLDTAAELTQEQHRADKLANENERLTSEASTDPLTSIPNRRAYDDRMESCVAHRLRHGAEHSVGLLILDLDHFKAVNDTWGHQVGDDVLRGAAARLAESCRAGEHVSRMGGEEFGVILPVVRREELAMAAERFRRTIFERPFVTSSGEIFVTVSIGGALTDQVTVDTPRALYEAADQALYAAKTTGRNCVNVAE